MSVTTSCASCGVEFCLPDGLYRSRRRDGGSFYCPNGHSLSYRPTEDEKRIAELEQRLAHRGRLLDRFREDLDEVYAAREELIGVLKECPGRCGWRSRKQVARDPVAMGRGIERVQRDVVEHLMCEHGARSTPVLALPERT